MCKVWYSLTILNETEATTTSNSRIGCVKEKAKKASSMCKQIANWQAEWSKTLRNSFYQHPLQTLHHIHTITLIFRRLNRRRIHDKWKHSITHSYSREETLLPHRVDCCVISTRENFCVIWESYLWPRGRGMRQRAPRCTPGCRACCWLHQLIFEEIGSAFRLETAFFSWVQCEYSRYSHLVSLPSLAYHSCHKVAWSSVNRSGHNE